LSWNKTAPREWITTEKPFLHDFFRADSETTDIVLEKLEKNYQLD
jgi:hypothetical protein